MSKPRAGAGKVSGGESPYRAPVYGSFQYRGIFQSLVQGAERVPERTCPVRRLTRHYVAALSICITLIDAITSLCSPKFGLERLKSISRTQRHQVSGNPLSPPL